MLDTSKPVVADVTGIAQLFVAFNFVSESTNRLLISPSYLHQGIEDPLVESEVHQVLNPITSL